MKERFPLALLILGLLLISSATMAQYPSTNLDSYSLKIFRVESGLYPFVQVYFRTFNQDMEPLVNLNELNTGVMVKGRSYDLAKRQYMVQSIRNRDEAISAVLVLDTSGSMAGTPFESALRAAVRFIESKRPQDQVAIIAISDNKDGYEIVSNFERDGQALARRLADIRASSHKTRLYDAIAAAMQMSALAGQGGTKSADAEYVASSSIIVFSDGKDEGSAISRSDLMGRISNMRIPVPIYSLAYTKVPAEYLKNLQALSKNTFGKYFDIGQAYHQMIRSVEEIQNIVQNDYVLTFRSYVPVDGDEHLLKVGIEYPSRSGKFRYETARFEAIEPPPLSKVIALQQRLDKILVALPDGNPYLTNPFVATLPDSKAPAKEK